MRRLLPLTLLLAACAGALPSASGARLDFQSATVDGARAVLTPRFDGGSGAIAVTGTTSTPCVAQPVDGALDAPAGELVLSVAPRPVGPCLTAIGYRAYTARITGLEPGVYRVRVVYTVGAQTMEAGQADVRVR